MSDKTHTYHADCRLPSYKELCDWLAKRHEELKSDGWHEIDAHPSVKEVYDWLSAQTNCATLLEAAKPLLDALEFYAGDEDGESSWMEPDSSLMYWTLWQNGDNVGPDEARKALKDFHEKWGSDE